MPLRRKPSKQRKPTKKRKPIRKTRKAVPRRRPAIRGAAAPASDARVIAACEEFWEDNKSDCSGFVLAVAAELGVTLAGDANAITAAIQKAGWTALTDGTAAATQAAAGQLVLGGLTGSEHDPASAHGHVVVVVSGSLAQGKYPHAYWGTLGGVGKKNETTNWAWNTKSRDRVHYAARSLA